MGGGVKERHDGVGAKDRKEGVSGRDRGGDREPPGGGRGRETGKERQGTDRRGYRAPPKLTQGEKKGGSGTEGHHEAFGKQRGPHARAAGSHQNWRRRTTSKFINKD